MNYRTCNLRFYVFHPPYRYIEPNISQISLTEPVIYKLNRIWLFTYTRMKLQTWKQIRGARIRDTRRQRGVKPVMTAEGVYQGSFSAIVFRYLKTGFRLRGYAEIAVVISSDHWIRLSLAVLCSN